jgi:hypothetical protein
MRAISCRGCGNPVQVGDRTRPSEYYCGDQCKPRCTFPGCQTPAAALGDRCWHHRNSHVEPADVVLVPVFDPRTWTPTEGPGT